MFAPIAEDVQALHVRAASQIRDAITEGRLKPGDRLATERDLALTLRVSRTVIRDALKLLSGEGLISVVHGRGIFVATPDDKKLTQRIGALLSIHSGTLAELLEVRRTLEGEAAAWAAERATSDQVAAMRAIVVEYDQRLQDGRLTAEGAMRLDLDLHQVIIAAAGNEVLAEIMQGLQSLLIRSRRRTMSVPERRAAFVDEMGCLIEAIAAGQAEPARQRMLVHLDGARRLLTQWEETVIGNSGRQ